MIRTIHTRTGTAALVVAAALARPAPPRTPTRPTCVRPTHATRRPSGTPAPRGRRGRTSGQSTPRDATERARRRRNPRRHAQPQGRADHRGRLSSGTTPRSAPAARSESSSSSPAAPPRSHAGIGPREDWPPDDPTHLDRRRQRVPNARALPPWRHATRRRHGHRLGLTRTAPLQFDGAGASGPIAAESLSVTCRRSNPRRARKRARHRTFLSDSVEHLCGVHSGVQSERDSAQLRTTNVALRRRTRALEPGSVRPGARRSQVQFLSPR